MQLLLPGCNGSKQHACHPACLQGWLARLKTWITFSSSTFSASFLNHHPHLLLRHSTCPVCRQTLAIEQEEQEEQEVEEEVGYDGGDESVEGE